MSVMHGFRATSNLLSCTETVHVGPARHARVGVQHNGPQPCTTAVQHTLHGFSATQDNRYRTTDPDMHCVQVGRFPLPDFTTTHLAQLNHVRNQQTARAERSAPMSDETGEEEFMGVISEIQCACGGSAISSAALAGNRRVVTTFTCLACGEWIATATSEFAEGARQAEAS